MIRASKIRAVATHEFLTTVKRKAYLITTFGMPLFVLLYLGFFSMIGVVSERKSESKVRVFGVLDDAAVLSLTGEREVEPVEVPEEIRAALQASGKARGLDRALGVMGKTVFRPVENRESALAEIASGELQGLFILERDYLDTGALESYHADGVDLGTGDARRQLGRLIGNRLLEGKVPEDVVERVRRPFPERSQRTARSGPGASSPRCRS